MFLQVVYAHTSTRGALLLCTLNHSLIGKQLWKSHALVALPASVGRVSWPVVHIVLASGHLAEGA